MATRRKLTEDMQTNQEEVGGVITLMERLKAFIDKHGLKGTFTTLLTLFIASVVGYFTFNPGALFEKIDEYRTEQHNIAINSRLAASPQIYSILHEMRTKLKADRCWVLEPHNGSENLAELPFLYANITYVDPMEERDWMESVYDDTNISRYPYCSYIFDNEYAFKNIEEVKEIDPELYYRFKKDGVVYIGMMMMYDYNKTPTGVLGVVYKSEENVPEDHESVIRVMQKYSNVVTTLLSGKNKKI